jgi:uncharacterized membrane protein YeaQ/YmgE (transglycosylase-associated protein family)
MPGILITVARRAGVHREVTTVLIIAIILLGMLAGAAAQLIFRDGKRPIDWTVAIVVGLIGSFVGGLLISLISGDGIALRPSGIIGSIVGAVVVTGIYKLVTGRAPGRSARR